MLPSYHGQLLAIRELLLDPASEIVQEGYDLLFKLWLSNHENAEFKQELLHVIIDHSQMVGEFTNRLSKLDLSNSITNTYLRKVLETLASDVENYKSQLPRASEPFASEVSNYKLDHPKDDTQPKVRIPEIELSENATKHNSPFKIWASTLIQKLNKPRIVISSIIAIVIIIWAFYLLPQKGPINWTISPDVTSNYTYPKYLSVHDQNTINFPIVNSNNTTFEGTITLIFEDSSVMAMPVAGQSLSNDLSVPPHGRQTIPFNFLLADKPSESKIEFYFQISDPMGTTYRSNEESFLISPIPRLRSTSAWLFGSAGLGALILALLWEQFKKWLGLK